MSESIIEQVEGQGSSYVVRVELLNPDADPELDTIGYRSPTPFYTIWGGSEPISHHSPHAAVRTLPGTNHWLLEELQRLRNEIWESTELES